MHRPREETIPLRADYGRGTYRRRIHLRADEALVRGQLEDDFHHFAVTLRHDGQGVREARGEGIRVPWTTCPDSVALVERLRELPLTRSLLTIALHTDPRLQCTHLFDLASLAVCHAARQQAGGGAVRTYDIGLPDRRDGSTRTTLSRDGEPLLCWRIEGLRTTEAEPAVFAGRNLSAATFGLWAERQLEPDLAEAALVLRRAVFIGLGRQYDFDQIRRAETFTQVVGAACHTFRPEVVSEARRVMGTVRDFGSGPEKLLSTL